LRITANFGGWFLYGLGYFFGFGGLRNITNFSLANFRPANFFLRTGFANHSQFAGGSEEGALGSGGIAAEFVEPIGVFAIGDGEGCSEAFLGELHGYFVHELHD
jgi:hypothetical protein